jgi:ABC-2 type transport system ATP-binding protein
VSDLIVETIDLRKTYRNRGGRFVAVDGLSMQVPAGGVHGFLGPNGSGKTTTIRMLLGLARASGGRMRLFGEEVPQHLPAVMGQIGAIVEQPKFFPTFTGHKNLSLLARTIGVESRQVHAVLDEVGLAERGDDRYKTYSLGMKQRLAIAATLLKQPRLLILDEPTNGLDPAGIREIRDTIIGLGSRGVTVILSSHILAEVQQACDSVSIIGHGRLLASGSVDEVIGDSGRGLRVVVDDLDRGFEVLRSRSFSVRREAAHLIVENAADPSAITRELAESGQYVSELTPLRDDLESVFLELTRTPEQGEGSPAPPPSSQVEVSP